MLLLMSCFENTYVHVDDAPLPGEDHFTAFGQIRTTCDNVVIKRASHAYSFVNDIPTEIELLYMVRHPLDVCTSTLSYRGQVYENYIPVDRWLNECEALKWALDARKHRMITARYEDLVLEPDEAQGRLAQFFDLLIKQPFSTMHLTKSVSEDINSTINGLRPPDAASIGRWREPRRSGHVKSVWKSLGQRGQWFCAGFGYDVAEIEAHFSRL